MQPIADQKFFNQTLPNANSTKYSLKLGMGSLTNSTTSEIRWNTTLLTALNDDMFRRLAPAVAFLVATMVVGAVGNIIVCYIFCRKLRPSSQNFLLLSLGSFDLASCCIGIPSEIFDIRHYYMYESLIGCKTMRFLTTLPNLASVLMLLVIAADRYRKICKPLHHQMHRCHVKISLVIIVVFASLFSTPTLFIYGHRILPTPIPGEFGYDCSISETHRSQQYHVMYEGLFCALFIVCTVALVLIYVKIWRETKRHIKYMKTHAMFGSGFLGDKYNASSGTSDENISDSRRNSEATSMNSVGVQRCFICVRGKTRKKCVQLVDVDASKSVVTPVIKLNSPQMGRANSVVPESYSSVLKIKHKTADVSTPSEVFELGLANKKENVSLGWFPNSDNDIQCGVPEGINNEEEERQIYDATDDDDPFLGDIKQRKKSESLSNSFENRAEDHRKSDTKPGSRRPKSCIYSLEPQCNSQDTDKQSSKFSDTKHNKSFQLCLYSKERNNDNEDDRQSILSDNNEVDDIPGSVLHSMETNSKVRDVPQAITPTDPVCQDHRCNNLREKTQRNIEQYSLSRQDSYSSQSCSDNESVELDNFQSKRVSFSRDLDDCDYSPPVIDVLEVSETNCLKLQRSRSDQSLLSAKRSKKALRSTRMTILAFAITLGFIISYLPYLILALLRSVVANFGHEFDDVSLNVYNIFLRSYFANNVINVFVYSFMHLEFRTQLSHLWKRLTRSGPGDRNCHISGRV
ncbi:unnamed protein product [Candidula unifasciata]|uniref:G-protein coupled receptors family 1 profile domain-containing protein n=1 Tax=Candidula unifasciata TaxID=100452 RepID=A0A8S3Z0C7_9EUPU|nr:unnamed protein product [Candidula unifasciata]